MRWEGERIRASNDNGQGCAWAAIVLGVLAVCMPWGIVGAVVGVLCLVFRG